MLTLRTARLAWLAGHRDEAYDYWRQALASQRLPSSALYDAMAEGLRATVADGRPELGLELFEITERQLVSWTGQTRLAVASLGAFFAGRWDHPALDAEGGNDSLPELEVIRAWARLERGAEPADIERQAVAFEGRNLTPHAARLLQARALLAAGRPERALGHAASTLADLERAARVSIESAVLLPVAEWLVGRCHEALGDPERAADHLTRAGAFAPESFVGRR